MKKFATSFLFTMLLSGSVLAFTLPSPSVIDPKETKMKTCILQEAKQAFAQGALTKDNIDAQATKIAASCAAKTAIKNDAATVQLATTIIKSILK